MKENKDPEGTKEQNSLIETLATKESHFFLSGIDAPVSFVDNTNMHPRHKQAIDTRRSKEQQRRKAENDLNTIPKELAMQLIREQLQVLPLDGTAYTCHELKTALLRFKDTLTAIGSIQRRRLEAVKLYLSDLMDYNFDCISEENRPIFVEHLTKAKKVTSCGSVFGHELSMLTYHLYHAIQSI